MHPLFQHPPFQRCALASARISVSSGRGFAGAQAKTRRGFSRPEWQKLRERNEALDCRVYARSAAWIAGADRWTEAKVPVETGGDPSAPPAAPGTAAAPTAPAASAGRLRTASRPGRRVFRSSYLS